MNRCNWMVEEVVRQPPDWEVEAMLPKLDNIEDGRMDMATGRLMEEEKD